MKQYQVIDFYDHPVKGDIVATFDNLSDAQREAKRYAIEDCDGECDVDVIEVEV